MHISNHQLLLTNIGRLSFNTDFGTLKLKSIWGPIVLPGTPRAQTIGVATTNDIITLTQTSSDFIPGMLQAAADLLTSILEN